MVKETILFGERVEKTESNELGWVTLYDGKKGEPKIKSETLLGKKCIVFFPGDGTKSEKEANGCCKAVQGMLVQAGVSSENMPHLYGLGYRGHLHDEHRYQILTNLRQTQFGTEYVSDATGSEAPYYQPLFDEYILPLIIDEKGHPRSYSEIRKNLQNVTFATHCHGGFVAYQIEKMMADKLSELYPKQVKDLMSNVRMIHFSSRRPHEQNSYAKHLDIISQNDEMFADEAYLEYDDIHKQMHRSSLNGTSALIQISPNEEVLLLKKLTDNESDDVNQDADHSQILQIFSGTRKNFIQENEQAIHLVRSLLRFFVEHPEDARSVEAQLRALDPAFVDENIKRGKIFLESEKEDEKVRRGLLSLFSKLGADYGRSSGNDDKDILRQKDDEGHFLCEELIKRYQKIGDSRSLINYIKDTKNRLSATMRGELLVLAAQNCDWGLFKALGGPRQNIFQANFSQLKKIISTVRSNDLYHLLPFLQSVDINGKLGTSSEMLLMLMRKIKKVKRVIHKNQLESFFKAKLENIFHINSLRETTFKALMKQASLEEKKHIKSLLAEPRQKEAAKLYSLMQERDQFAPELRLKQMKEYKGIVGQYGQTVKLQDYREFVALHQASSSFDAFWKQKRQKNQSHEL